MSIGFIYWLLMILWIVFGVWRGWGDRYLIGGSILQFVLFFLLGWAVFGFPIHR
jgi:hypothetical protein